MKALVLFMILCRAQGFMSHSMPVQKALSTSALEHASNSEPTHPHLFSNKNEASVHPKQNNDFSEEQDKKLKRMRAIASSFTGDRTLQLKLAHHWQYDAQENILYIDQEEFKQLSEEDCIAMIVRESGYRAYSQVPEGLSNNPAQFLLFLTIERIRIDSYLSARHHGYKKLVKNLNNFAYPLSQASSYTIPLYQQFCMGILEEYYSKKPSLWVNSSKVRLALDTIRPFLTQVLKLPVTKKFMYVHGLTQDHIDEAAQKSSQIILNDIWPIFKHLIEAELESLNNSLKDPSQESAQEDQEGQEGQEGGSSSQQDGEGTSLGSEESKQDESTEHKQPAQSEATDQNEQKEELSEEQLEQLNQLLKALKNKLGLPEKGPSAPPQKKEEFEDTKPQGSLEEEQEASAQDETADDSSSSNEDDKPASDSDTAQDDPIEGANEEDSQESQENTDPSSTQEAEAREGSSPQSQEAYQNHDDLTDVIEDYLSDAQPYFKHFSKYESLRFKNLNLIKELVQLVKQLFQDDENPQLQGYYRSGVFDLQKYIEAQSRASATAYHDPKIFLRKEVPREKSVEIVMCIDQSGSMYGSKLDYSKEAVILLAEMAKDINLKWGLLSFEHYVKIMKELDQASHDESWKKTFMDLDPSGGTNDRLALETAVNMLAPRAVEKKIILILTDGEGDRKQAEYVKELSESSEYIIIGIGVGEGSEFVDKTYEHSVFVENISQLPYTLVDKLIEVLRFYK